MHKGKVVQIRVYDSLEEANSADGKFATLSFIMEGDEQKDASWFEDLIDSVLDHLYPRDNHITSADIDILKVTFADAEN